MRWIDSERRDPRSGRRQVLGTVGTGLAAVSTAGCLSSLPTMGQQVRYADVDAPGGYEPDYRAWTPGQFPGDGAGAVSNVDYLRPGIVADDVFVTGIHDLVERVFVASLDYLGVGYRNFDELLGVEDAIVGTGSFDAARVRETVLDTAYEPAGEYEGYDLFERSRGDRTIAVRDGTIVYSGAERAHETIERIVDANDGRHDRLHESDDGFRSVSDDLGAMPAMSFWRDGAGMADDLVAAFEPRWSVNCSTRDDEYVYEVSHTRFEREVDVSERRLRDHLEDNNEWIRAHTVDVTVTGTLVDVTVKWTREDALEWTDAKERPAPPQITWETTIDDGGDAVTVAHLAGDSVDAGDLTLTYAGEYEPPEPQFGDRFDTVEPGDELIVDVGDHPGTSLSVVYEPNESQALVLEHRELE